MKLRNFFTALLLLPLCIFASLNGSGSPERLLDGIFTQVNSVGPLKAASFVVNDIDATIASWSAATGTEFSPVTKSTRLVILAEGGPRFITLKSAYSVKGEPFLEIVESNASVGPWAPQNGPGGATNHLVFSVDHVHQASKIMKDAGFKKIAICGDEFAFFRGENGVLVKIINNCLLPTSAENVSQAPIDFGDIRHIDLSVSKYPELQTQLGQINGSTWTEFGFQGAPFQFEDGVHVIDVTAAITDILPELQLEYVVPALGVFGNSDTSYNMHPAYVIPAGGMDNANTQMIAKGFTLNSSFTLPGVGLIIALYQGVGDTSVELVDERFNF